ncbi:hypothetical protein [Streptomyces sp. NPDC058401]|uniref:hypothetical protein n=1 Tax=Streptomyces sp. NPDC058401 TaxID=3346480 RepID=UPI0036496547
MAPREIDEETAAGQLALFLVWLTKGATVRQLADRFEPSSSTWGNYLNGSQLIPKPVLKALLEAFTEPGPARNTAVRDAWERWKAADTERSSARATPGREVMRQHQRLEDALEQVLRYQKFVAKAQEHLAELRVMLAYTESRLEKTELQLQMADERERARAELRLGQARERLSRVRIQQERARGRRMTAEEQQEFWMTEALNAQEEISRLERETRDLIVVPQGSLQPVRQDTADEVDDAAFENRLAHITAEGLEDEALIEEDLQPDTDPDGPYLLLTVQDAVQPLSKTPLDKPPTSNDIDRQAALTRVAQTLHAAGPARLATALHATGPTRLVPAQRAAITPETSPNPPPEPLWRALLLWLGIFAYEPNPTSSPIATALALEPAPETPSFWAKDSIKPLGLLLGFALFAIAVTWYLMAQGEAAQYDNVSGRVPAVITATILCLIPLYCALRLMTVPKMTARILASALHLVWITLMLFDLFPWPAISRK